MKLTVRIARPLAKAKGSIKDNPELIREKRVDKRGRVVTRYVRPETAYTDDDLPEMRRRVEAGWRQELQGTADDHFNGDTEGAHAAVRALTAEGLKEWAAFTQRRPDLSPAQAAQEAQELQERYPFLPEVIMLIASVGEGVVATVAQELGISTEEAREAMLASPQNKGVRSLIEMGLDVVGL